MLSKVKLQNFKCIEKVELELVPLTIFLGENGTGKSSVLEALASLKQGKGREVHNAYNAELVKLGDFNEVVHKGEERWVSIRTDVKPSEEEIKTLYETDLPPECTPEGYTEIGHEVSIRGLREIKHKAIAQDKELIEVGTIKEDGYKDMVLQPQEGFIWSYKSSLPDWGRFEHFIINRRLSNGTIKQCARRFSEAFLRTIIKRLDNVYYISAIRGDIPRDSRLGKGSHFSSLKAQGKEWVGVQGEYTLDLLSTIFRVAKPRLELRKKREKIAKWAGEFGINELEAGLTGEADDKGAIISSTFIDLKLGSILNPASSGAGSRQLLPVITQIFYSEPGDTIMIEEPEMSLHIKAQRKLMEMFAEALKERKQIIVTTHSEHIPLALRTVIPSGKLNSEDVAIYHFERDKETGVAKAQRLSLSSKGAIKNWIPSYVEAEREVIKEWMSNIPEA